MTTIEKVVQALDGAANIRLFAIRVNGSIVEFVTSEGSDFLPENGSGAGGDVERWLKEHGSG